MPTYLAHDPELLDVPLEPPTAELIAPDDSREAAALTRTWKLHGGLLRTLSAKVGVDAACAVAVLCVESGGAGFGPDGRMIIRFENHVFEREWGGRSFAENFRHNAERPWEGHEFRAGPAEPWAAFHGRQAMEWRVFDFARRRNRTAAMRSISMGAPQIMGFNHARIGYDTVEEMFAAFSSDVRFQIIGLFDFLAGGAADSAILEALRRRDFGQFASSYNGPGQAAVYGELINRHCERFEQLRRAAGGGATARAVTASSRATSITRGVASPPMLATGTLPPRTYVVKAGDTLGAIAGRYGVPLSAIVTANAMANANVIRAGQLLTIPQTDAPPAQPVPEHQPPTDLDEDEPGATVRTYTVAPGDTLGAIARRLRIGMSVLVALNDISNPDRIRAGEVLRLPD